MIRLGLSLLLALSVLYAAGSLRGWDWLDPGTRPEPPQETTRVVEVEPPAAAVPTPEPQPAAAPEPAPEPEPVDEVVAEPARPPRLEPEVPEPEAVAVAEPTAEAPDPDDLGLGLDAPPPPPDPADLDRSAELVRRMLSLYRSTERRR